MNPIDKFEWKENWAAEKGMLEYVSQLVAMVIPRRWETEEVSAVTISKDDAKPKFDLSQRFVLLPSESVLLFAARYNERVFPKALNYEDYLRNADIQSLIEELGLDRGKFWFAILFAYDYSKHLCLEKTIWVLFACIVVLCWASSFTLPSRVEVGHDSVLLENAVNTNNENAATLPGFDAPATEAATESAN